MQPFGMYVELQEVKPTRADMADLVNLRFDVEPSVRILCSRTASSMFHSGTGTNIEKKNATLAKFRESARYGNSST